MKKIFKTSVFLPAVLMSSCNFISEDSCYDRGQLWDSENTICSDDCIGSGGIFDISDKRCEIPVSGAKKTNRETLLSSVETACSDVQKILKSAFNISDMTALEHSNALEHRYAKFAPISYTDKYNFGQDGVCNFALDNDDRIKIFIRKNAKLKSAYSLGEFDILKIEKKQTNIETPQIIWERD